MKLRYLLVIPILLVLFVPLGFLHAQDDQRCFPETGHCISGRIRSYWEQNGRLSVFGLPIAPQHEATIEGQPYQVQWFERARLELHPENPPPYDVLLGRLGGEYVDAAQTSGAWTSPQPEAPQEGCVHFATGWNVCGDILQTFRASGLQLDGQPGLSLEENIALFGLPVTPLVTMDIAGTQYHVQWFERARFELHPENAPPYHVLLGLLGAEVHAGSAPVASTMQNATLPVATTPAPEPAPAQPAETEPGDELDEASDYSDLGGDYRSEGDYDQAIAAYTQAIALEPDNARYYYLRGVTYTQKRDYGQAIADYTQAITLAPDGAGYYVARGNAYQALDNQQQADADYQQAITLYTEAIAEQPDNASLYAGRANVYSDTGKL